MLAVVLVRANATQERLVTALQAQLTVDALTGLATRRAVDGAPEKVLRRSVPGGTALALVRSDDAVLSRSGGDELAVLMPGCR